MNGQSISDGCCAALAGCAGLGAVEKKLSILSLSDGGLGGGGGAAVGGGGAVDAGWGGVAEATAGAGAVAGGGAAEVLAGGAAGRTIPTEPALHPDKTSAKASHAAVGTPSHEPVRYRSPRIPGISAQSIIQKTYAAATIRG